MQLLHADVTDKIIGAAYEVYREFGYGFLEAVYRNAMKVEMTNRGLRVQDEAEILIKYKGIVVGKYRADLLVNEVVLVELKIAKQYNPLDEAQLLNELKGTGIRVGLLINFGREKAQVRPRESASKTPRILTLTFSVFFRALPC